MTRATVVLQQVRFMAAALLVTMVAACQDSGDTSGDGQVATGERPEGVSPLFQPLPDSAEHPEDNPGTPERIALGHELFFEPKLSRSGIISCNTCHVVGAGGGGRPRDRHR